MFDKIMNVIAVVILLIEVYLLTYILPMTYIFITGN